MFNFCAFSGEVLDKPELGFTKNDNVVTTFNLAIRVLDQEVGSIKVYCFGHLTAVAAKYLHQGDRAAVLGFLYMDSWQGVDGQWRNEAHVVAIDLEIVKAAGPQLEVTEPARSGA